MEPALASAHADPGDLPIYPRLLVRHRAARPIGPSGSSQRGMRGREHGEVSLLDPAAEYLADAGERIHDFRCIHVVARPEDGISKACELLEAGLSRARGAPRIIPLEGPKREDAEPPILKVFTPGALVRAAHRAGLVSFAYRYRLWAAPALLATAALAAAGSSMLTAATASQGQRPGGGWQPIAIAVILGVLSAMSALFVNMVRPDQRRDESTRARVLDALTQRARRDPAVRRRLVNLLAAELAVGVGLRCLIVDDFGRLDPLTEDVLLTYLQRYLRPRRPELWVVFDAHAGPDPSAFAKAVTAIGIRTGRNTIDRLSPKKQTHSYDMPALSRQQRSELARLVGHPERASLLTVKAITAHTEPSFEQQFDQLYSSGDPDHRSELQLLYLLSIASSFGGTVEWRGTHLAGKLVEATVRRNVLQLILTGLPITRDAVHKRLLRLPESFANVSVSTAEGQLSVPPAVAQYLSSTGRGQQVWARYGLPDPDLVHLYWALYRFDFKSEPVGGAFWTTKLIGHLKRATLPAELALRLDDHARLVAANFWEALHWAISACLASGSLADVLSLLDRAQRALPHPAEPATVRRLLRLSRDAYGVLGEDDVLRLVLDVAAIGIDDSPTDTSEQNSLLALFAQTTGWLRLSQRTAAELAPGHLLATLRADIEVRGAWLALSLLPYLYWETAALVPAVVHAVREVGALVRPVLDTCLNHHEDYYAAEQVGGRSYDVAALATLSTGLWAWALSLVPAERRPSSATLDAVRALAATASPSGAPDAAGPAADITEALGDAFTFAGVVRDKRGRNNQRSTLDFAVDGMLMELVAVVAAAALLVVATVPPQRRDTLGKLIRDALSDLGADISGELAGRPNRRLAPLVADQLLLVQATWNALGYEQFAASVGVRRAQFGSLTYTQEDYDRYGADLRSSTLADSERSDVLGLLANLATAERPRLPEEIVAEMVVRGATVVLDTMDQGLVTGLCMTSLRYANAHRTDVEYIVDYLLRPTASGEPRLATVLSEVDDDDRVADELALWLSNVAYLQGIDQAQVLALTRERVGRIVTPEVRVRAQSVLDEGALRYRVRQGETVDVDAVLDAWSDRRELHVYPWVLVHLLPTGHTGSLPPRWEAQARAVLADHRDYQASNGILNLAIRLAALPEPDLLRFGTADLVIVMRESLRELQQRADTAEVKEALAFLFRYDVAHAEEYEARLREVTATELRLFKERQLSQLVQSGRYALLFLSYYRMLVGYGLRKYTDGGAASSAAGAPPVGTAPWLADLERYAEPTPSAFIVGTQDQLLSQMYLSVVEALFESDRREDQSLAHLQSEYNRVAELALPRLFELMADLDRLPDQLHAVLREHKQLVLSSREMNAVDPSTLS